MGESLGLGSIRSWLLPSSVSVLPVLPGVPRCAEQGLLLNPAWLPACAAHETFQLSYREDGFLGLVTLGVHIFQLSIYSFSYDLSALWRSWC